MVPVMMLSYIVKVINLSLLELFFIHFERDNGEYEIIMHSTIWDLKKRAREN